MSGLRFISMFAVAICTLGHSYSLHAESLAFPTQQRNWLNSQPLDLESMKGKAALLWFYEEG